MGGAQSCAIAVFEGIEDAHDVRADRVAVRGTLIARDGIGGLRNSARGAEGSTGNDKTGNQERSRHRTHFASPWAMTCLSESDRFWQLACDPLVRLAFATRWVGGTTTRTNVPGQKPSRRYKLAGAQQACAPTVATKTKGRTGRNACPTRCVRRLPGCAKQRGAQAASLQRARPAAAPERRRQKWPGRPG